MSGNQEGVEAAVRATLVDSKVSGGIYKRLGIEVAGLKKAITQEISRGIATGLGYGDIARNLANATGAPFSRTKTIARTEGHRIQQASAADAQQAAKDRGADVVKQWDAALDGKTRPSHRMVDGEIRELDEKFSNGLMYPGDPNGPAAEVINCRCTSDTRARWALNEEELQTLKDRAAFFGLDKTENFEEFKSKFLQANSDMMDFSQKIVERTDQKSLANLRKILYNDSPAKKSEKKAREAYNRLIDSGELTPMASFELFQTISKEIDNVIVGTTTANAIVVTGKSEHFIARVIGSISQRRSGVNVSDIVLALTEPDRIDPIRVNPSTGAKSQRFIKLHMCAVTINPDTGNLIQVNPLGG